MTKAFLTATLVAVGLSLLSAQEVRNNVNVLPINPNFLKGDLYLQRQLEPTIAISTRNPNNLAAFYVDYRTVGFGGDISVGEELQASTGLWSTVTGWLAKLIGRPTPGTHAPAPIAASPAEANIGFSRSRDGGLTWTGALLPGLSFDSVPSPIKNYSATSDPVALSG